NHFVRQQFNECIELYSVSVELPHRVPDARLQRLRGVLRVLQAGVPGDLRPDTGPDGGRRRGHSMYRPDDELKRLAQLALDLGLDDQFIDGCNPSSVLAALAGRGEAGQRWLDALEAAKDPWFHVSTGDGFYHHHRSWADDLTVPFSALPRYVAMLRAGESLDRPTEQLAADRDRITAEYRALLGTDEERAAFDQMPTWPVPYRLPVRRGPQVLLVSTGSRPGSSRRSGRSGSCWPGVAWSRTQRMSSTCTTVRSPRR
ncbi:hypothetical protein ACRAWF_30450, partial [Streptomyces sp. L7]